MYPLIDFSIQVFLFGQCRVYGKRPRHGRDDCLRDWMPCICKVSDYVNKMTSKARAASRRACTPDWQSRNRHDQPERRPYSFPYRRVKGGCWGHGLGSSACCRQSMASWRLYATSGLNTKTVCMASCREREKQKWACFKLSYQTFVFKTD